MATKMYEIEFSADTQGQANDLLRQATDQVLYASEGGQLGWVYTGPAKYVFALRDLLAGRQIEHSVSGR